MKQIGRYRVAEQLGFGAMGTVYRALDPTIGRTVAIKAIRLTDFIDPSEKQRVRERLLQEARVAGVLSHPSIITIFDVLEEESSAFIVMEYVQGSSLQDLLDARKLPDRAKLVQYLEQVGDALDYAHHKGVIHRDIKLANILISFEERSGGLAKISDFGISKFISQNTTHSGTMVGTPSYMAPEQIQGLALDGRSDQYSLAIAVYEMLTGVKPFAAESLATLFYQICKQDPRPPEELNGTLGPAVGQVLARALAKEPDSRFPSCSDFVGALSRALKASGDWTVVGATEHANAARASAAAVSGSEPAGVIVDAPALVERNAPDGVPGPGLDEVSPGVPPQLPPLTRRYRLDAADSRDEASGVSPRKKLMFVLAALAVCGALFYFLQASSREENSNGRASGKPEAMAPTNTGDRAKSQPVAPPPVKQGEKTERAGTSGTPERQMEPVAPAQSAAPRAATLNQFFVTSEPRGARVVFDERPETGCKTPCIFNLPPGRHTLTAELNGFDTARRIFNLPEDRELALALGQSMGVLVVTTEPAGSTVIVDGKEYGRSPLTVRLTVGNHQLTIVNGAGRHEETVLIQNDQFTSRSFQWR